MLVYAHQPELPKHEVARRRLTELAEGDASWALPVFVAGEFLRVISHPRLFDPPYSPREACEALGRVLASPSLRLLRPGVRYVPLLEEAVREADAAGNLVFDAQIVALCREAGVRALLTDDRDFDRFEGLTPERLPEP